MGASHWLTAALCAVLAGRCAAQCPNQCSGHGSCGAGNACTCDAQYAFAADCSLMSCPKGTAWADKASAANTGHSQQECSNQGLCVRATGACACNPGFTGRACSRMLCPNMCSGHGVCQTTRDMGLYDGPDMLVSGSSIAGGDGEGNEALDEAWRQHLMTQCPKQGSQRSKGLKPAE